MQELSQELSQKFTQESAQESRQNNYGFLIQASNQTRRGEFLTLSDSQDAASCSGHCKAGSCIAI